MNRNRKYIRTFHAKVKVLFRNMTPKTLFMPLKYESNWFMKTNDITNSFSGTTLW